MRKTIFWVVICITLPIIICALYFSYSAIFDDRMFLKNETERVTGLLKDVRIGEEFMWKCFRLLQVTETQTETRYTQN